MKSPYPYPGGKSKITPEVWKRFGRVKNVTDPFFGSGAFILGNPYWFPGCDIIETVNDKDGFISNFWRAVQSAPDEVAKFADWPVNENDLHARHSWLLGQRETIVPKLEGNPDFYDAKVAGWWVWGMCCWIGSGFCSGNGPWVVNEAGELVNGREGGVKRQRPSLQDAGRGVNRQGVHLGSAGQGINRKMVHLVPGGNGMQTEKVGDNLYAMMRELSDRLRRVRVCSGDWSRICGPTPTFKNGLTAVFLDPPYNADADREGDLYRVDDLDVSNAVREWAIANGDNPMMRIALCGYEGEHELPTDWECLSWKANGGYGSQGDGRGRENAKRERVWFSPHCVKVGASLFD